MSRSGGWRYIAQRLTGDGSGEFLDFDVPLSGVQITDTLSGHNGLTGTISPEYARLKGPDGLPLLDEWGTAIYAENQGVIRGGGILTHSGFDGPKWDLECTGFTGYLDGLAWISSPAGDYMGVEVDPLDVARVVWNHAQSKPGGNLGLEISSLKTGLKIGTKLKQGEFDTQNGPLVFESGPVQLNWYSTQDLGDFMNQLAQSTPFDWHERHYWDGETLRHVLDFAYPAMGRRRKDLRFVVGENVVQIPQVTRDGSQYASEVLVMGKGDGGPATKRGTAFRKTGKLRRTAVVTDSSLRTNGACDKAAAAEVARRVDLDDFTDISVIGSKSAPIGSVNVGDEILIEGELGWRTLSAWARVISVTIAPDSGNIMGMSIIRSDKLAS